MSFKLRHLRLVPQGKDGLGSGELRFGDFLTWVCGPNGSGKTPVMKGLMRALGLSAASTPDVRDHVKEVRLGVAVDDDCLELVRAPAEKQVEIVRDGKVIETFEREQDLSQWLFPRLGIEERQLLGKDGGVVPPYASVVFPTFLVAQDSGWVSTYQPANAFIVRDQEEEVRRWMLGLRQLHTPEIDGAFDQAQKALKDVSVRLAAQKILQKTLREDAKRKDVREFDNLIARRDKLRKSLHDRESTLETLSGAFSEYDTEINELEHQLRELRHEAQLIEARAKRLEATWRKIEADIAVLDSNEDAASAFRILCGSDHCQFFRAPEESYGRRLLYLKDQLKDLRISSDSAVQDRAHREAAIQDLISRVSAASQKKKQVANHPPLRRAAEALEDLAMKLTSLDLRIARARQLRQCDERVAILAARRTAAAERVKELRPKGRRRAEVRALDARKNLATSMESWMTTLRTRNVRGAVSFDENLRLFIGDERFTGQSSQSGSTRARIVLAYHAALLETSRAHHGQHPGLLVLDAPRQHELHLVDLHAYVDRLRGLSSDSGRPFQLVLSLAEEPQRAEPGDEVWRPEFKGNDGPRYLGASESQEPDA